MLFIVLQIDFVRRSMTLKKIDIDEKTYNRLVKKKKNNETLSEVIDKYLFD